jgi:hypothetical protein
MPTSQLPERAMDHRLPAAVVALAALLPAACAPEDPALGPPSPRVQAAADPQLVPTAGFDAALASGPRDITRIEGESDALAARAAALRARAEALQAAPPMSPEDSARLRPAPDTGN